MGCSLALKEAVKSAGKTLGIDIRHKLDDVLSDTTTKLSSKQVVGYLKKQGVSPKEIKASGIESYKGKDVMTGPEWVEQLKVMDNPHHFRSTTGKGHDTENIEGFSAITMDKQAVGNPTYKEEKM